MSLQRSGVGNAQGDSKGHFLEATEGKSKFSEVDIDHRRLYRLIFTFNLKCKILHIKKFYY